MTVTVTTQSELDAALAANESPIYIESPEHVTLTLVARGSSHVEARDSSRVEARGSSRVEAWDSSHVEARDSSRVEARGSSRVEAWDSSHVVARDSSHVVAGRFVAVHVHSQHVTVEGGVVIDLTAVDLTDPATWCEFHGVKVGDGSVSLFKALDEHYESGHQHNRTRYEVGCEVVCSDWRDDNECGGGLHLGPSTHHATAYRTDAKRWVRVDVALDDLRPILVGTPKCKVRSCRVVAEVDRYGVDVSGGAS
jgi:hypothetical protein